MHHRIKIGLAAATIAALGLVGAGGSSGVFTAAWASQQQVLHHKRAAKHLPDHSNYWPIEIGRVHKKTVHPKRHRRSSCPRAASCSAAVQTDSFSEVQIKLIEKIVKDYLLVHPEVLQEVQEAMERKQEQARADATRVHLPMLYKSVAAISTDLAGMSIGKGDVTVIEFFDYNCGYCRKSLADVVKLVENDTNVKVQFMEYPILAPESRDASRVAVAAAKQGKYFEFHKAMFAAGRASRDSALRVAEQLGLDMTRLKADMASPETDALLSRIADAGKQMFIDGTPTFVVGDKVNPGWTQFDQLKALVSDARKEGCRACADAAAPSGTKDKTKS